MKRGLIVFCFSLMLFSILLVAAVLPKPVLYFNFEKTFSPEIMNTKFFFDPNPKIYGKVRLVSKDNGYCLYFDGESFMRYKATNLLDYEKFSVSLWIIPKYISTFNRTDWDNMTTLFSVRTNIQYDSPEWALTLYKSRGDTYAFLFYTSKNNQFMGWSFNIEKDLTDNKWHNLVLTKEPNVIKLYIDGELTGTANLKINEKFVNVLRSDYLYLGGSRRNALRSRFKGYLDDFAVWDKVLTYDQIQNIYNHGGIGKEEKQAGEIDIEKAKTKLREAYNEGKISYEQLKKALNELMSGNVSKLLSDFINGVVSVDDFSILY